MEDIYAAENPTSRAQFERDRRSMPGGAKGAYFYKPYPLTMERGEGCYLYDVDMNGDGRVDLLGTASAGNQVVWYENPGDPVHKPWRKHSIDSPQRPIHGHPVDMDGDGDVDVVMALGMLPQDHQHNGVPLEHHQIVWYENEGNPTQAL